MSSVRHKSLLQSSFPLALTYGRYRVMQCIDLFFLLSVYICRDSAPLALSLVQLFNLILLTLIYFCCWHNGMFINHYNPRCFKKNSLYPVTQFQQFLPSRTHTFSEILLWIFLCVWTESPLKCMTDCCRENCLTAR